MENNEKNQADKKPCLLGFDGSKQTINSMQNFAMASTSHGYDQQQNSWSPNQADKKPCVPDDSKQGINSVENVAMPSTSQGCDDQRQQYSNIFNEVFTRLDRCDVDENEIPELLECFQEKLTGYRFDAKDDKLITEYLRKKTAHEPVHRCFIRDANVYEQHPKELAESYPRHDPLADEWYFFSPRERKYPNGTRPNRAAGNGYWKATGADRPVEVNDETVGFKQALVFYEGKAPKGVKTNWIMHEFKGMEKRERSSKDDMKLDDYVLCRIYCKKEKSPKEEEEEEEIDEEEKEEEGPSSKSVEAEANQNEEHKVPPAADAIIFTAEANQDEEYKVPPYDAGAINLTAGANQEEEYNVPPYDADDIIVAVAEKNFNTNTFFWDNEEQWQL